MLGLLARLVTLPVAGPVKGVAWVAERVAEEAEQQQYDETQITAELAELARSYEAGEIGEREHDEIEAALLARLVEARRRQPHDDIDRP